MNLQKTVYFFILLLSINITNSQIQKDSLKLIWENKEVADSTRFKALSKHINLLRFNKPDSAIIVANYYYKIAKEKNNFEQMAWAINFKGLSHLYQQDFNKSKKLFKEALELASKVNDTILEATIIGNLGITHSKLKDYSEATLLYTNALKSYKEFKDEDGESRMLNNLAGLYYVIGDYDMALNYYNKTLELFKKNKINNTRNGALLMLNIGGAELKKENYDKALSAFNNSLKYFKSKNNKLFEAITLRDLAEANYQSKNYQKASTDAKDAALIFRNLDEKLELYKANIILGKIAYESDINKATRIAETILTNLPKSVSKELKIDVYELLYKCYKAKNNTRLSLNMYENYNIYKDSIQEEKNNFAIIKQTIKNDFDILLYESKLENEKIQSQLKLKQNKRVFTIILVSLVLLSLLIFYLRKLKLDNKKKRTDLLNQIEHLKRNSTTNLVVDSNKFELVREEIEASIQRKLNETDWKVLNILLEEPEITNKEIAERAFMSVDGIGSSLRRMYEYFNIKDSKYKKITLLTDAIKRSKTSFTSFL